MNRKGAKAQREKMAPTRAKWMLLVAVPVGLLLALLPIARKRRRWLVTQDLLYEMAQRKPQLSKVREFLAEGADVNAHDKSGYTPLLMAARGIRGTTIPFVRLLLNSGAHPNDKSLDDCGKTALILAVEGHGLKSVRFLLAKGADANAHDRGGDSPLLLAAIGCSHDGGGCPDDADSTVPFVRLLLRYGANPNDKVPDAAGGETALMCAVQRGERQSLDLLLAKGANVNAHTPADFGSLTALDFAHEGLHNFHYCDTDCGKYAQYPQIEKLLLKAGAKKASAKP